MEIGADVILKATRVNGVYDKDPETHEDAVFFAEISYMEVLERRLKVMDATAISLCMENKLPIIVFNMKKKDNMRRVVLGEPVWHYREGVTMSSEIMEELEEKLGKSIKYAQEGSVQA